MGFPCWRYHATEPRRRVVNEAEASALGAGWCDSPKTAQTARAATRVAAPPVATDPPKTARAAKRAAG